MVGADAAAGLALALLSVRHRVFAFTGERDRGRVSHRAGAGPVRRGGSGGPPNGNQCGADRPG